MHLIIWTTFIIYNIQNGSFALNSATKDSDVLLWFVCLISLQIVILVLEGAIIVGFIFLSGKRGLFLLHNMIYLWMIVIVIRILWKYNFWLDIYISMNLYFSLPEVESGYIIIQSNYQCNLVRFWVGGYLPKMTLLSFFFFFPLQIWVFMRFLFSIGWGGC